MISIPFAWTHESVEEITVDSQDWIGSIGEGYEWYYADYMLLLTFGGIPWQVMYSNTFLMIFRDTFQTIAQVSQNYSNFHCALIYSLLSFDVRPIEYERKVLYLQMYSLRLFSI